MAFKTFSKILSQLNTCSRMEAIPKATLTSHNTMKRNQPPEYLVFQSSDPRRYNKNSQIYSQLDRIYKRRPIFIENPPKVRLRTIVKKKNVLQNSVKGSPMLSITSPTKTTNYKKGKKTKNITIRTNKFSKDRRSMNESTSKLLKMVAEELKELTPRTEEVSQKHTERISQKPRERDQVSQNTVEQISQKFTERATRKPTEDMYGKTIEKDMLKQSQKSNLVRWIKKPKIRQNTRTSQTANPEKRESPLSVPQYNTVNELKPSSKLVYPGHKLTVSSDILNDFKREETEETNLQSDSNRTPSATEKLLKHKIVTEKKDISGQPQPVENHTYHAQKATVSPKQDTDATKKSLAKKNPAPVLSYGDYVRTTGPKKMTAAERKKVSDMLQPAHYVVTQKKPARKSLMN